MTLSYNIVCYALVRGEQKPIVRLFARLLVGNIPVREKPLMLLVCFAHLARESTAMVVLYYQTATLKWHSRH